MRRLLVLQQGLRRRHQRQRRRYRRTILQSRILRSSILLDLYPLLEFARAILTVCEGHLQDAISQFPRSLQQHRFRPNRNLRHLLEGREFSMSVSFHLFSAISLNSKDFEPAIRRAVRGTSGMGASWRCAASDSGVKTPSSLRR